MNVAAQHRQLTQHTTEKLRLGLENTTDLRIAFLRRSSVHE